MYEELNAEEQLKPKGYNITVYTTMFVFTSSYLRFHNIIRFQTNCDIKNDKAQQCIGTSNSCHTNSRMIDVNAIVYRNVYKQIKIISL